MTVRSHLKPLYQVSDVDSDTLWIVARDQLEHMYESTELEFQSELNKIHTKIEKLTSMGRNIGEYNRFFYYIITKIEEAKFSNPKYWHLSKLEITKDFKKDEYLAEFNKLFDEMLPDIEIGNIILRKYLDCSIESVIKSCALEFNKST